MPIRLVRVTATLLVCAAGLVAGEADDVTLSYSYEDVADGRDIKEGIYGSQGAGEFDEWRLHLGVAPGLDRVEVKTSLNGQTYFGESKIEVDRILNDPPLPPQIGLMWVLGDFEGGDHGWFSTLGLEYTHRQYQIIYEIKVLSPPLNMDSLTVHFGMGYAWYLSSRVRYEFEPFINGGMMWTQMDLVDLASLAPTIKVNGGPVIEGGLRNALIWHPGNSQGWHFGASLDYRAGYAQTIYDETNGTDNIRSEIRMKWAGFGGSVFYGAKF